MDSTFWEVRQAIAITAFFGGLRLTECLDLKLEQMIRSKKGYTIIHTRAKQRTDKMSTKFLVPEERGYTKRLTIYLNKVNNQLSKFQGRVWYTGRKSDALTSQFMGKNMVFKVPNDIAVVFNIPEPTKFTFHSFRRTSATRAADAGATTEQS
jgi:integrase